MNDHPDELKAKLNAVIAATADKLREEGKFQRNRKLSAEEVIRLLISMQGGSLNKELRNACANVTAAAFYMRRRQVTSRDMETVFENFNLCCSDTRTFQGYRIFAVDGTTVNLPRNPQSESFMRNAGHPNGLNQLHVTPLFDVLSNTYQYCVIQPQKSQDEIGALLFRLAWYDFNTPTLVIADRGFESYEVIAAFQEKPYADFLIRIRQNRSAMKEIQKLPEQELDRDLSFYVTTSQTKAAKEAGHIIGSPRDLLAIFQAFYAMSW